MSDPVRFVDISDRLHKVRNRIYRVGVELEGGWTAVPRGMAVAHDGSVRFGAADILRLPLEQRNNLTVGLTVGELPSPAMELTQMPAWVRTCYPQLVNATCGMHVHMSFQSALHYGRLMKEDFMWTMVEYLRRWALAANLPADHCFFPRLRGESEYCQLKFFADYQAQTSRKEFEHFAPQGHRYTAINYAYSRVGTIECRLPPMMPDADKAISLISEVCAITSAFLVKDAKREIGIAGSTLAPAGTWSEQRIHSI